MFKCIFFVAKTLMYVPNQKLAFKNDPSLKNIHW